ncbi:MAG: HAMP domain-containing histidine kinase, partial [Oscillospiraceae bacterium]|nr:HAMP domain-containing histidine kinase [Oscillospiraceae bacterium]
ARTLCYDVIYNNIAEAVEYANSKNIVSFSVKSEGEKVINKSWNGNQSATDTVELVYEYYTKDGDNYLYFGQYYADYYGDIYYDTPIPTPRPTDMPGTASTAPESSVERYDHIRYTVTLAVPATLAEMCDADEYYFAALTSDIAYDLQWWVYVIAVVSIALLFVCFVYLMSASGVHRGENGDEVRPGWGTKVPVDLLTAVAVFAVIGLIALVVELSYYNDDIMPMIAAIAAVSFVGLVIFLGWCMSIATRFKLRRWWKNSVVFYVLAFIWRLVKRFFRFLKKLFLPLAVMFKTVPLVWKSIAVFVGVCIIEAIFIAVTWWNRDSLVILWVIEKVILFVGVLYIALVMRDLKLGGEALRTGNLSYKVNTSRMIWDFKDHGENLNSIAGGMTNAVNERMKSERMKTELITNVSHDIKTPLTSIINYTDIIAKENCENEKVREYSVVLLRQSERLKKLIDDLVEASKASTGNLEIHLAPCDACVFVSQAAGEYAERLAAAQLQLVTKMPEKTVSIMADGRRLGRVFDNLMNNICKYSQSGTRVYLTLEEHANEAIFSFKNTSREELNISEEELMERFVRGDSSRNTEGSGLGLSIAKSLTELQGGSIAVTVDGDLFKVILRFPKC